MPLNHSHADINDLFGADLRLHLETSHGRLWAKIRHYLSDPECEDIHSDYHTDPEDIALDAMGVDYIDQFIDAYIECALWSETADIVVNDDGTVSEAPTDGTYDTSFQSLNFDESDLTSEAIDSIRADCVAFIADNSAWLKQVSAHHTENGWTYAAQSGHDFWLTRNGHGAGFWDRGYGTLGDLLTGACEPYGSSHLFAYVPGADTLTGADIADIKIGVDNI